MKIFCQFLEPACVLFTLKLVYAVLEDNQPDNQNVPKYNHTAAEMFCKNQGRSLPSKGDSILNNTKELVGDKDNVTIWTPIVLRPLSGFNWTEYEEIAEVEPKSVYECGHIGLNTIEKSLESSDCSIGQHGIICQNNKVSNCSCTPGTPKLKCQAEIMEGFCFVAHCYDRGDELPWMIAQNYCHENGGYLLTTTSLLNKLSKMTEPQEANCRQYSVGFKNFILVNNNTGAEVKPHELTWTNKIWPDRSECVTVTIDGDGDMVWAPEQCAAQHSVVCQPSGAAGQERKADQRIIIGSSVGSCLVVAIIFIAVGFCCRRKKCKKQLNQSDSQPDASKTLLQLKEQETQDQNENSTTNGNGGNRRGVVDESQKTVSELIKKFDPTKGNEQGVASGQTDTTVQGATGSTV